MERLFRRAGLQLSMTEGFHPKPRMAFPLALALGHEGLQEVMELELTEELPADTVLERLQANTIPGLEFRSVEVLPPGAKKGRVTESTFVIDLPEDRLAEADDQIRRFMAQTSLEIVRPKKGSRVDLRKTVRSLEIDELGHLTMRLEVSEGTDASPREILQVIGLEDIESRGRHFTRTDVRLAGQAV
mgnify:CR=1 FL=1